MKLKISVLIFVIIFLQTKGTKVFSQADYPFNVLNYEINLDLYNNFKKPTTYSFTANEVVTISPSEIVAQITLDANGISLEIDSVGLSAISFFHIDNFLTINLDRFYQKDELFDVKIYYKHKNVFDSAFYVGDGIVYTDCETIGARRWFPCKDVPDDKATLSLTARTPSDVLFGSNGLLSDSVSYGDTLSYKWVSSHPIATYLIAFAGKVKYNLDVMNWKSPNGENIPLRFYWQRGETVFNLSNVKNKTGKMLDFFSELLGDYPFEKLGFATVDRQFPWGGMENQTFITLCPDCWTEDLICHELAHQWFGDMITPQTWSNIWLNEGFATYSEALWVEHNSGYKGYKKNIEKEASVYLSNNPGWAIYEREWNETIPNDDTLFSPAICYSKAACVIHQLRYVLGDSVFFDCLMNYTRNPMYKFGNITTSEFMNFVEGTSGKDLDWFFGQWIYEPNHPVYQNNFNTEEVKNGKWKLDYTINQIQKNTVFFKMPVEIMVTFKNASDTLIKVDNSYNLQTFSFEFKDEPMKVSFDPNNQIVLKEVK